MEVLVSILSIVMIYMAVRTVGWVLGPLDRAAKDRSYPIQFSLADFLCLFVQVQLALCVPALLLRGMETSRDTSFAVGITVLLIVALALLVWWTGVRTLSRAGVHGTLARSLTLTVLIPFGYVSSISAAIVPMCILSSALVPESAFSIDGKLLLIELALLLFVFGLGLISRRIVATAQRQREKAAPDKPEAPG